MIFQCFSAVIETEYMGMSKKIMLVQNTVPMVTLPHSASSARSWNKFALQASTEGKFLSDLSTLTLSNFVTITYVGE
jgi:hypothetical protein